MPTLSRNPEPAWPCWVRLRRVLAVLGLLAGQAAAHEPGAETLPEQPGWRFGAAAALLIPSASEPWPALTWPGLLQPSGSPRDQRGGLRLEHGTLDAGLRFNARFGASLALGWHDRDRAHIEAARLQASWPLGGSEVELSLGRDTVRMGQAIDSAGHFDTFSQMPLAKRGVLAESWLDDGMTASWRRTVARGIRTVELGLRRGQGFPGGRHGPLMPSLHLHGGWDHVDGHLFLAHLEPDGRGSPLLSAGGKPGHAHGPLDCRSSLQQRACFDGRVDVLGASAQWTAPGGALTLSLAGLARREQGLLYSISSAAQYRATIQGVWADANWTFHPAWTVSGRMERLVPSNSVVGAGAGLLAREAGLLQGGPIRRVSTALAYRFSRSLSLTLEAGEEHAAADRLHHLALRLLWREARWAGGGW